MRRWFAAAPDGSGEIENRQRGASRGFVGFKRRCLASLLDRSPAGGMFGTSRYTIDKLQMEPGDSLLLYTDGISEASNA